MHRAAEESAKPGGADAPAAHFLGVGGEVPLHAVLNDEALDGARAGDALVEVPGNAGVHLADLAVHTREVTLEEAEEQHRKGQHGDHQQRETQVRKQHDRNRAQEVAALPGAV